MDMLWTKCKDGGTCRMQLFSYSGVDENGIDMVARVWEVDGTCPDGGNHECRCVLIKETIYSEREALNAPYVPYQVVEDIIGTSITAEELERLQRYEGEREAETLTRRRYRVFAACVRTNRTPVKAAKYKGEKNKMKKPKEKATHTRRT